MEDHLELVSENVCQRFILAQVLHFPPDHIEVLIVVVEGELDPDNEVLSVVRQKLQFGLKILVPLRSSQHFLELLWLEKVEVLQDVQKDHRLLRIVFLLLQKLIHHRLQFFLLKYLLYHHVLSVEVMLRVHLPNVVVRDLRRLENEGMDQERVQVEVREVTTSGLRPTFTSAVLLRPEQLLDLVLFIFD